MTICPHCGARLPAGTPGELCPFCVVDDPQVEGVRVLGDCELFEEIGRGGMGVVWRGRQRGLNREVAVKTLPGGDLAGAEARARFRTEAQAAARLHHPGIVAVHEVGEADGMPYFVMEFIRGKTLSALAAEKSLPPRSAARIIRDAALAVQHAHDHGVLHRDIKPSNILIEPGADGGTPRVSDFGLAKITDAESGITLTGSAAGSPAYMAPEQARHSEATALTDVYGLGASLYFLLTGRAPHSGESLATVFAQVEHEEPLPPRRLAASVPRDLETSCLKCLEKNPSHRYRSAAELAADLTRFLDGRPVHARPAGTFGRVLRFARRRPWQAAAALLTAAMVAGVAFSLAWKNRRERQHSAALATEQAATRLALIRAQLGEARAIIRLRQHDSRPRAEAMLRETLAANPPGELRAEARDVAVAAAALPTARTIPLRGEGVATDDWTMTAGDLAHDRWALASYRGPVVLRALDGEKNLTSIAITPRIVTALIGFSGGGRWLAMRHGEELGVWDTTSESAPPFIARAWPAGRAFGFGKIALSPKDDAVLWQDGDAIVASALPGGAELHRWTAPSQALAFEPSGKLFALARSDTPSVELRRWPEGGIERTYAGLFSRPLTTLAMSAGAQLIAGGDAAGRVTVWRSDGAVDSLVEFRGHGEAIRALAFSRDGRLLVSTSEDGTLRVWDCAAAAELVSLPFDAACVSFSAEGRRMGTGFAGGGLRFVEIEPSPIFHSIRPAEPPQNLQVVSFFPDGKSLALLTARGAATVAVPGGELLGIFPAEAAASVRAVPGAVVVAGNVVATTSSQTGAATRTAITLKGSDRTWDALTTSADGRWIAATDNAAARAALWAVGDAEATSVRYLPSDNTAGAGPIALSPDAARAAIAFRYEPGLQILDTAAARETHRLALPPRHNLDWSADGKLLAACGTGHFVWDTATWQRRPLPPLAPNHPPAGGVAFSPVGKELPLLLALTQCDTRIALLTPPSLHIAATLEAPLPRAIYKLEFSRDHRWLAAATARGEVHLWDMPALATHLATLGLAW